MVVNVLTYGIDLMEGWCFNKLVVYLVVVNVLTYGRDLMEGWCFPQVFDSDSAGVIHIDSLRHVLSNLGERLSEREMEELLQICDGDSMSVDGKAIGFP